MHNYTKAGNVYIKCSETKNSLTLDVSKEDMFIVHSCSHLHLSITQNDEETTVKARRRIQIVVLAAHLLEIQNVSRVQATLEIYSDAELTVLPEVLESQLLLQVTQTDVLLTGARYSIQEGAISWDTDEPSLSVTGAETLNVSDSLMEVKAVKLSSVETVSFKNSTLYSDGSAKLLDIGIMELSEANVKIKTIFAI